DPTQYDHLAITGLADIMGGSIEILFGNGFVPAAGENFDLLSATLGLKLDGVSFDVIGLPSGLEFTEAVGANGFDLSFGPASAASVPEPASVGLLGLGVLAMLAFRRKAVTRLSRSPKTALEQAR